MQALNHLPGCSILVAYALQHMEFLQIQFNTCQHCKVSYSSTIDAAKAMSVEGMSSEILHRHSIGQPGPNLSTETIKLQKRTIAFSKPYCIQIFTEWTTFQD